MSEAPSKRGLFAIAVSILAMIVSIVTAYFGLWRPVTVEMTVSPDILVSNTLGGVPDAYVALTLRADGATEQAATIQQVELFLENLTLKKNATLRASSSLQGIQLPVVLRGKDVAALTFLFQVDDSIREAIHRYDSWCDALGSHLPPEKNEEVKAIRKTIKEALLGEDFTTATSEEQGQSGPFAPLMRWMGEWSEAFGITESKKLSELNQKAAKLLTGLKSEAAERVLFVRPGSYKALISARDPAGIVLAEQAFRFDVDDVMNDVLTKRFNQNVPVRLTRTDVK